MKKRADVPVAIYRDFAIYTYSDFTPESIYEPFWQFIIYSVITGKRVYGSAFRYDSEEAAISAAKEFIDHFDSTYQIEDEVIVEDELNRMAAKKRTSSRSRAMKKKAGSYGTILVTSPDDEAFDYLYGNSAFTWEGMTSDQDNLNAIYDAFVEEGFAPKDGLRFYVISGAAMNSRYGLVGNNAYPDDLTILSIPLDDFGSDAGGHLYIWKFEVGARWFDDIVDNNARHNAKKASRKAMKKRIR